MAITDWPKPLSEAQNKHCTLEAEHFCRVTPEDDTACMLWRAGKMKIEGVEEDVGWCGAGGKPEDKYFVGAFVYP